MVLFLLHSLDLPLMLMNVLLVCCLCCWVPICRYQPAGTRRTTDVQGSELKPERCMEEVDRRWTMNIRQERLCGVREVDGLDEGRRLATPEGNNRNET